LQSGRAGNKGAGKSQYQECDSQYPADQDEQMSQAVLLFRFIPDVFQKLQVGKIYFPVPPEVKQVYDNGNGNGQQPEQPVWVEELHEINTQLECVYCMQM